MLDLVWVNDTLGEYQPLIVRMADRHRGDHAVLQWSIPICPTEDNTPHITKSSPAAKAFIEAIAVGFTNLPQTFTSRQDVEATGEQLQGILDHAWEEHASVPRRSKRSKTWWDADCAEKATRLAHDRAELTSARTEKRRAQRSHDDNNVARWSRQIHSINEHIAATHRSLRKSVRKAKRSFFDSAIHKLKNHQIWDAVQWTRPRRMATTTGIVKPNGDAATTAEETRDAFQTQFTPDNPRAVDETIIDDIPDVPTRDFPPIAVNEILEALEKTSNTSAPEPDRLSWYWIKRLTKLAPGAAAFLKAFFNACITYGIMPTVFKRSHTVIIPKPNKPDYSKAKAYRPIILLNCLGKLLEKVLARRMQFDAQKYGIMHPCQFGGTIQHNTTDAGIQLVHNIRQA